MAGKRTEVPEGNYLNAVDWLRGIIRATIRPRPHIRMWRWLDQHVRIPEESGGPCTGPLRTGRVPQFRGLYDLFEKSCVHYFTFCASARIGKTLFSICVLLYWIAEKFGAAVWLDPTRSSAAKLVRSELDEFLLQCPPVHALAIAPPPHPASRKFWTTLVKAFRGKLFRIIGSGAEADLHGFNAELAINNELDRQRHALNRDASSSDKIEARTKLFTATRKILDNSTPGEGGELSPIWQRFIARSQHYCYLPCPHCSETGSQRPETGKNQGNSAQLSPITGELDGNYSGFPAQKSPEIPNNSPFIPPSWDDVEPGRSPQSYEPWLKGWQRLTFFVEQKLVPFEFEPNGQLKTFPKRTAREQWREETTGQFKFSQFAIYEDRPRVDDPTRTEPVKVGYDIEEVERSTTYECADCKKEIAFTDLPWMLDRFWWVPHNPYAPADKLSAHQWSAYNPFEKWGIIAKEFIEAKGNISALIKFFNMTLGLPFIRQGAAIKEDDLDRVIARAPVRYVQGQLPMEAELLTMTIDRQDEQYWFGIRAWGILWDHPERPTWSALVDWGEAVSWAQLLELAGLIPNSEGRLRKFKFRRPDGTEREYVVTAGLADSGDGDHTKTVYEFCLANREVFSPYKGGGQQQLRGNPIRLTPVMEEEIDLVWAWSDFFASNLYFDCIKNGATFSGPVHWWLPTNIDKHYREQLTDEFYGEKPDGKMGWNSRRKLNHLGDMEKMQRVMTGKIEERFDEIRDERAAAEAAAEEKAES